MDRDWDQSLSRPPIGSGSFPPSAVPRVLLPLLVWVPCFIFGLAGTLGDDKSTAGLAFLLAESALAAILAAVVVWLWLPRPRKWQWEPALALLGILLGAFLGAVAVMSYGAGGFLPYLAGWGGRELEDFGGGDFSWQDWLVWFFLVFPVVGAIVCGASGFIAWALRFLWPRRRTKAGQA